MKIAPVVKGIETGASRVPERGLIRLKIAPVVKGIETDHSVCLAIEMDAIENCPGS